MKKLALISAIAMGGLLTKTADAQIGINIGFRLAPHRIYAPAPRVVAEAPVYREEEQPVVYDGGDDYYYLPDLGAYYNVAEQSYYYNDGGSWVSAAFVPGYRNYDWRNARRFEVHAARPYLNDRFYNSRYGGYNANHGRYDEHVYANRDFNRDNNRQDEPRFDNRNNNRQDEPRFNNRNNFNDRGREREPEHFDRGRDFNQPQPQNHNQGNFNQPSNGGYEKHGNSGNQPAPENRGQGNHSQQSNGNQRGNGQQQYSNARMQGGQDRFSRS